MSKKEKTINQKEKSHAGGGESYGCHAFSCYCDEWLLICRSRIKESTYAKYFSILEKHIKPRLGAYSADCLSSLVIQQFSYDLSSKERLAPKTIKDILTVLKSILRYADKYVPGLIAISEVAFPKNPKRETRILNQAEQKRLVQFLLKDMDNYKFGILLSLLTGMRIGEVCALRWCSISMDEKTIQIDATMQRIQNHDESRSSKTKILIDTPKSDSSLRKIPMTDFTVKICSNRFCEDPRAFVLTGRQDKYIEPRILQYNLKKYTRECQLKDVHFHTLRHPYVKPKTKKFAYFSQFSFRLRNCSLSSLSAAAKNACSFSFSSGNRHPKVLPPILQ